MKPVKISERMPTDADGEVVFAWGRFDAGTFGNNEVGRSALEVLSEDGYEFWMSIPPPFERMRTLSESMKRIDEIGK